MYIYIYIQRYRYMIYHLYLCIYALTGDQACKSAIPLVSGFYPHFGYGYSDSSRMSKLEGNNETFGCFPDGPDK